jgi:hypothetical protein
MSPIAGAAPDVAGAALPTASGQSGRPGGASDQEMFDKLVQQQGMQLNNTLRMQMNTMSASFNEAASRKGSLDDEESDQ